MASTVSPGPAAPRPSVRRWDVAGLCIVGAQAGWTLVASIGRGGARPLPVLALLVTSVLLFGAARIVARTQDRRLPQLVALGIGATFLLTWPGVLSSGGAPTEYGNTNGTLAGLGVIAAALAAHDERGAARRWWAALAVALLGCVVFSESVAAWVALAAATSLAAVALARRNASIAAVGGFVAVLVAVGLTTALAGGAEGGTLTEQNRLRTALWERALDLARDAPARGRGPGAFERSVSALDLDLRWAHHEYLQQAAEVGVVGLVLLLLLIGWLFAYLWWGGVRRLVRTVAGASAVTFVALHAAVDHVLHTAFVPLTLAVLVGWATADPRAPDTPG